MKFNSREEIIALTPEWKGERFPDGRPRVPDKYLEAMRKMTLEELWKPIFVKGYISQFEGDLKTLHNDGRKLIGRAVTCSFVPTRPDLHEVAFATGAAEGRKGNYNQWVNMTIVIATHKSEEIAEFADKVLVLKEGPFEDLVVHIGNHDVALDQGVDDPLVVVALSALCRTGSKGNLVQVGTRGNEGAGYGSADQLSAVVVQRAQVSLKLADVSLDEDRLPKLLKRHFSHCLQILVRNAGTTVLESLALPLGRQGDNIFSAVEFHLLSFPLDRVKNSL